MLTDEEDADGAELFVEYEPTFFREAVKDDDNDKWQAALMEE